MTTPDELDAQIACVERELRLRARVYPRRVSAQQMTQAQADRETEIMTAVLATLQRLRAVTPRAQGELL